MFGSLYRVVATAAVAYFSMTVPANAQYAPCSTCNAPAPMMARPLFPRLRARAAMRQCCAPAPACPCPIQQCPIQQCPIQQYPVQQFQPVVMQQPVQYRQVAVTEYQQFKQKVKKPVHEVKYVDQKVTEYKQITEQKTVSVPTVSYRNVTSYRTQMRDMGAWQTSRQCVNKMSPCQYDNRPTLLGMMNRSGYAIRNAFTPNYITRRQYVPRMVAQQIPVTQQVAVRGTQKMTYNVAKVVPVQTTRKVAVNSVKWVDEEVTTTRPVTVMKTVPGTQTAYGFVPFAPATGTRTATKPTPDPISNQSAPKTATRKNGRETSSVQPKQNRFQQIRHASASTTKSFKTTPPATRTKAYPAAVTSESKTRSLPTIVRNGGWRARSPQKSSPTEAKPLPARFPSAGGVEVANAHH